MISKVNFKEFSDAVGMDNTTNIFIFAPNFEERSMGGYFDLLQNNFFNNNCGVFITTLQGIRPPEILDEIKAENTERLIQSLKINNIKSLNKVFPYPIKNYNSYFKEIINFALSFNNPVNLYFDISSIPRNIIFRFFDYLFDHRDQTVIKVKNLIIKSLKFIYTPAESYPAKMHIDLLGGIIGMYEESPFHVLIKDHDLIDMFLFISGNSHDASHAYSLTTEQSITPNIDRHIYVYLNKDSLLHSYRKVANNIGVIDNAIRRGDRINYVFSLEHVAKSLFNSINSLEERHRSFNSLAIFGAFGPKPLQMCSYLAKVRYDFLMRNKPRKIKSTADVLGLDSSQYTSLYSYGRKETTVYNINFQKLFECKKLESIYI